MDNDFLCIDSTDFYDWKALDRLHEKRAKKEFQLLKIIEKTNIALAKHRELDAILKKRANNTGYYWG